MNEIQMQSEQISNLMEALSKAQAIMQGAKEDSNNPYFKSKYADLTSIWEACRDPLTRNGLSIVQTIQFMGGERCLVSILGHSSGQWIKSVIPLRPSKEDIQALGSAITYCRRYSLAALVGVCPIDDDGEAAMNRSKLDFPSSINPDKLAEFLSKTAEEAGCKIEDVKKRAEKNMKGFLDIFYKWEKESTLKSVG